MTEAERKLASLGWGDILEQWNAIECDLQEVFGIDVESGILKQRSWRWLKTRIVSLLGGRTRLASALGLLGGGE